MRLQGWRIERDFFTVLCALLASMIRTIKIFCLTIFVLVVSFDFLPAQSGQININRIESMPNLPQPYFMRNWKQVAQKYDSLVFKQDLEGQYLPLIWYKSSGINYPEHGRFGLHTYVGTKNPAQAEAINILPAVIGASLVGIDKQNQFGRNWVLMCEDFFNRRPEQNVYLNNFYGQSGNDWWYDTMPNVFFYQLYDLYPETGHFGQQFVTVADRWLEALKKMGGSAAPWKVPNLNHRAWNLSTMLPNDDGVKEPEAAGAIGWLMYMAYRRLNDEKYRIGAEWSMEFLDQFPVNPSYELQLPYGVYLAARMNAELGTNYNMEKLLNWCFDSEGNVRGWGVTVGSWGGYDCSGLVGEVIGDDYAFAMNTFEMIGNLVPLTRYDERFARAIGKWTLNAANASRLFYGKFLPAQNQDGEQWAWQYDPQGVIAYEALRETDWYSNTQPFATGDALRSGWAETNLALYGSSHVGILGAIIDTTNVRGILKLNVRSTDFFSETPYPMYLIYNPYLNDTTIVINAGSESVDLYDAVSNQDLASGVSGNVGLNLQADQAILICLIPSNAERIYDGERLIIDGNIIDFHTQNTLENHPPRIKALAAEKTEISPSQSVEIYCTAEDRDGDELNYKWTSTGGSITGNSGNITWQAPETEGTFTVRTTVTDGKQGADSAFILLKVSNNRPPVIDELKAEPSEVMPGDTVKLQCLASDPDNDELNYRWWVVPGDTFSSDSQAQWKTPSEIGYYYIHCRVTDQKGLFAEDSVGVSNGDLVINLPLDGSADDLSGFGNNGLITEAVPTENRTGQLNKALYFDGENDLVLIPNKPALNFQNAVTVASWMRVDSFYSREAYPFSHGNWENRWKVSVTNRRLRWTVKTADGVSDLDSKTELQKGRFYYVVCTYDQSEMKIFIDGRLDSQKSWSGAILQTSYDLTLGQVLPGNTQYNFRGILDNFRLYNRALSETEISSLYDSETTLRENSAPLLPESFLEQNYPNPFNPVTTIRYRVKKKGHVKLSVFDCQGRTVQILKDEEQMPGSYSVQWNAANVSSGVYFYRLQIDNWQSVRKCLKLK